jgi:acetyl-CoA C-acetyltransferase
MNAALIIDAVRTPRGIGKVGKGALSGIHPQRLLSAVLKSISERNNLDTQDIEDVIVGCGTQIEKQGSCIARMAALDAGWAESAAGVTIDRFCGSGLTAINMAASGIMSGMQDLMVGGGVESMSYIMTLRPKAFLDSDNLHLRSMHPQSHQGICADLIATLAGITRNDVDEAAVESQRRAAVAIKDGRFKKSLVPVYHDDGTLALDHEEYPRPSTTLEALSKLTPAFAAIYDRPVDAEGSTYRKLVEQVYPEVTINHVHHAGNSSGIVDGAAAVLLAAPDYAKAHGLKSRARIRAFATAANSPVLMLDAPATAARKVLAKAGMTLDDIDLFEVNEAFAAVSIRFVRELALDPTMVNVNGGAMALGHPIGATGAMLVGTLLDELERRDLNVGMVTLCTAGGMAPALIIERI